MISLPSSMQQSFSLAGGYLFQVLQHIDIAPDALERLLVAHFIDVERLSQDMQYRVPFYKVTGLLDSVVSLSEDPMSAIRAVFQLRVKSFPVLGYAVIASRTLREGLSRLAELEVLVWDVGKITLREQDGQCHLIWAPRTDVPPLIVEMAISGWVSIGQQLFADQRQLISLAFVHHPRADKQDYEAYFDSPVEFGASENRICFPVEWLDECLVDGDESLSTLMIQKAAPLLDQYDTHLNLENTLRARLFQTLPNELPDLDYLARQLEIPPRTLRYLLQEKGLNYRFLADEVRKEVACYLLNIPSVSLRDIAEYCGFAEQSSFNRAFRRWLNCAPSEYVHQVCR